MFKFLFSFLLIYTSFALEVDSKLTLRIVKISSSQKTILINRGIEDGLVKNDHAKFFLSTGVVARGVAVKVSPTRSVWSLYRVVNNNYINTDQVLKLKITTALKITKDESRSLIKDDQSAVVSTNPRDLGIPLAAGAEDLDPKDKVMLNSSEKELGFSVSDMESLTTKKFEVFLSGSFEALSSSTKNSNNTYDGSESKYTLNLGVEYYFTAATGKLKNVALKAYLANSSSQTIAFNGSTSSETYTEFGGGISYHIYDPSRLNKIIPFVEGNILIGSVTSKFTSGENSVAQNVEVGGTSTALSAAGGMKYFTQSGLGFRVSLDFFTRSTKYEAQATNALEFDKTQSGPRLFMGLGYRF